MDKFKTLVWTDEKSKVLGKYAVIYEGVLAGCDLPDLLTMDATIDKLKVIFPAVDYSAVKLVTVQVIETN